MTNLIQKIDFWLTIRSMDKAIRSSHDLEKAAADLLNALIENNRDHDR